MKKYLVGGAVRDKLLNRTPADYDYVVTGTSHEELLRLGFSPVGQSFGIYLHPVTKEEYTLADNLEDDLSRRDITINAMALDEAGHLIDPFHGSHDIERRILKHVKTENLEEDPIRVLRIFRIHSKLTEFKIAPETDSLLHDLNLRDKTLLPDRLWNELHLALLTNKPSVFFDDLKRYRLLRIFYPEIINTDLLDAVSEITSNTIIRFSVVEIERKMKIPNDFNNAAFLVRNHLHEISDVQNLLKVYYQSDAFRKPENVEILSKAYEAKYGKANPAIKECYELVKDVSFKDVDASLKGREISEAIRREREKRIKKYIG